MEFKTLKSFVAVAEQKNFSAAARELNTVQPAISRHISDLEKELGVRLFWRNTREVKITAAGESLFRDAIKILSHEVDTKKRAQLAAQGKIGHLRIGYLGPACFTFIPQLVQTYSKLYPDIEINLQEMTVRQQLEAFESEQIDIGFSRKLPKSLEKDFGVEDVYIDTLIAVVPKTHPLSNSKSILLRQLEEDSFIFFNRHEAAGLFDQIISVFQEENIVPVITSQPQNMQVLITEVAAGLGVSVVPACIRNMYTEGCVFVPIQNQKPSIPTQLHYRSDSIPPSVEAFAKITLKNRLIIQKKMQL